jgi:hypothetical protein
VSVILVGVVEEALRVVMGRSASHCSIQGAKMLVLVII